MEASYGQSRGWFFLIVRSMDKVIVVPDIEPFDSAKDFGGTKLPFWVFITVATASAGAGATLHFRMIAPSSMLEA